ncbi:hypothetical protein CAPTEDRAFT_218934 [Capitella teleta]|uniref:DH domain-containing protein n=1 Tax=Capitella teleta TaxID=283909 RepID=R7V2C5_CAPTE|nr:hypothetical protein CAPTEDRAFT_218934 [Capitella teleta]|eukprot:ELU12632.1 hypothetical protein CAPTEDRAFT_218934 [Capitella teleta]
MSDDPENMQPEKPEVDLVQILQKQNFTNADCCEDENHHGGDEGEEADETEPEEDENPLHPAYSISDLVDGLDSNEEVDNQESPAPERGQDEPQEANDTGQPHCEEDKEEEKEKGEERELIAKCFENSDEVTVDNDLYDSTDSNENLSKEPKAKLVSDISGRFHVVGTEYSDQKEHLVRQQTPSPPPAISLETRRQKSLTLRRGTLGPSEEHIYDDVHIRGELTSEAVVFVEGTIAQILNHKMPNVDAALGMPGNPFADDGVFVNVDLDDAESLRSDQDIYENVGRSLSRSQTGEESDGWGSSEFESYEDTEDGSQGKRKGKLAENEVEEEDEASPAPVQPPKHKEPQSADDRRSAPTTPLTPSAMLDKLAARLPRFTRAEEDDEEDSLVMSLDIDLDKHPPAELPPTPPDLDMLSLKRRFIVATIVDSERSYTSSLRSLVEDYEMPLLQSSPQILPPKAVRTIFHKVREILQCHHMFHIELAETIRLWDTQQRIGNIFTASFSKVIVFEAYSSFVNNFSKAMDTAKKHARSKQAFADFLKQKILQASHKLSLFGLMVKPVQRFPQFIMLLQDLLKHTPREHDDRLALQMALTELESMTHRLNETKRESESRHDVMRIVRSLAGRSSALKSSHQRCLIRQDDCVAMDQVNGETKKKPRRLFLFNDILLCTSVLLKEGESGIVEKYRYKWSVPISEVEVVQSSVSSPYRVHIGHGKTTVHANKQALDRGGEHDEQHPYQKELDDMLHDLPVLEHISQLVSQLRLSYEGLNSELILSMTKSLQLMIQQKSDVDRCIIRLSIPAKGTSRVMHTFQVDAPGIKQDWLLELHNTKLGLDPGNHPGWSIPENQRAFAAKLPLFVKPLPLDVTKHDTKVQCAIPVVLPSPEFLGVGTQHLWVCSSSGATEESAGGSRITLVSLHTNQPHVLEVFPLDDAVVTCAALVPGYSRGERAMTFSEDTVWMGTDNCRIVVHYVVDDQREKAILSVDTSAKVHCLSFLDNRLYAGLEGGALVIYSRDIDGVWQLRQPQVLQLDSHPVTCLLGLNHEMWVGCGDSVHVVNVLTVYKNGGMKLEIQRSRQVVSMIQGEDCVQCMVKAAAGVVVSFKDRATLRLFHQESWQHLQDISIASAVANVLQEHEGWSEQCPVHVTCLLSSKGQLWIGTSIGCVLTLPLPRLEGVPQIKGRPSVAFHSHTGPVTFLSAVQCGASQLLKTESCTPSECSADSIAPEPGSTRSSLQLDGVTDTETDTEDLNQRFTLSDDFSAFVGSNPLMEMQRHRWTSTPDLRDITAEPDDVLALYGSLLQEEGEDFERALMGSEQHRHSRARLSAVSSRVNKFSEAVMRMGRAGSAQQLNPSPRFATLPVLRETAEQKNLSAASSSETSSNEAFSTPPGTAAGTPSLRVHKTVVPAYPTMVMSYHANAKRAIVVASHFCT